MTKFFATFALSFLLLLPAATHAQGNINDQWRGQVDNIGNRVYGSADISLEKTVGRLIRIAIGLLGVIFFILLFYAGFLWMTAAGNDKQVEKAKDMLVTAVVGLIITLAAYAIVSFVLQAVSEATGVETTAMLK